MEHFAVHFAVHFTAHIEPQHAPKTQAFFEKPTETQKTQAFSERTSTKANVICHMAKIARLNVEDCSFAATRREPPQFAARIVFFREISL